MHVILFFHIKCIVMSSHIAFFRQGIDLRRPRKWVSWLSTGCLYDSMVHVVYRCPVVNGVPLVHLSWQHKIVPAG
jgi:hypothetical protein